MPLPKVGTFGIVENPLVFKTFGESDSPPIILNVLGTENFNVIGTEAGDSIGVT